MDTNKSAIPIACSVRNYLKSRNVSIYKLLLVFIFKQCDNFWYAGTLVPSQVAKGLGVSYLARHNSNLTPEIVFRGIRRFGSLGSCHGFVIG